jgi:hypothetical protein
MRAAIYARMSAIVAPLAFAACVGSALAEPSAWKGADIERKRFEADKSACGREASQQTSSGVDWDYFKACMAARGWKRNEMPKEGRR